MVSRLGAYASYDVSPYDCELHCLTIENELVTFGDGIFHLVMKNYVAIEMLFLIKTITVCKLNVLAPMHHEINPTNVLNQSGATEYSCFPKTLSRMNSLGQRIHTMKNNGFVTFHVNSSKSFLISGRHQFYYHKV